MTKPKPDSQFRTILKLQVARAVDKTRRTDARTLEEEKMATKARENALAKRAQRDVATVEKHAASLRAQLASTKTRDAKKLGEQAGALGTLQEGVKSLKDDYKRAVAEGRTLSGQVGGLTAERDGLGARVKTVEADLQRTGGELRTAHDKAADLSGDLKATKAEADGNLKVARAEADRDVKVLGAEKDGRIGVLTAQREKDVGVLKAIGEKDVEVLRAQSEGQLAVARAEADRDIKVLDATKGADIARIAGNYERADDARINYKRATCILAGVAAVAIGIAYLTGRGSAPAPQDNKSATIDQKVETPKDGATTAPKDSAAPKDGVKAPETKGPTGVPSYSADELPNEYFAVVAKAEKWYVVEGNPTNVPYSVLVRNPAFGQPERITLIPIEAEAVENFRYLVSRAEKYDVENGMLKPEGKQSYDPDHQERLVRRLGASGKITSADVAKALQIVEKGGGLNEILSEK